MSDKDPSGSPSAAKVPSPGPVRSPPALPGSYLESLWTGFKYLNQAEFVPVSTWFSYGSNLFKQDFERKMVEKGSYLSLARARPARLTEWQRALNNESSTRGLAYSIGKGARDSFVDGIVHDVPIGDLPAFLRFEGVLDEDYALVNDVERRYDIQKVTAGLLRHDGEQDCFVLVGRCPVSNKAELEKRAKSNKKRLVEYVRTSIKGAVDFGLSTTRFENDLQWVRGFDQGLQD